MNWLLLDLMESLLPLHATRLGAEWGDKEYEQPREADSKKVHAEAANDDAAQEKKAA